MSMMIIFNKNNYILVSLVWKKVNFLAKEMVFFLIMNDMVFT